MSSYDPGDCSIPAELQFTREGRPPKRRPEPRVIPLECPTQEELNENLQQALDLARDLQFEAARRIAACRRKDRRIRCGLWALVLGWAGTALFWLSMAGTIRGWW